MNTYFRKILEEIKPEKLYRESLTRYFTEQTLDFSAYTGVYVLAIGKAASLEAKYFMEFVRERYQTEIEDYLIITKEDHGIEELEAKTFESSHPYLTGKSFEAAKLCRNFVNECSKSELVISLISGGSSALIEDFDNSQKNQLTEKLNTVLDSGINIDELNHLRKTFSKIKNGRLLEGCKAKVVTFLTSDIPNNNPFLIGSSPTLFEKISDERKQELIKKFGFENFQMEAESKDLRLDDKYEILIRYESLMPICQQYSRGKIKFRQQAYNDLLDEAWKKYCDEIDLNYLNISFGEFNIEVKGSGKGGRNTHFVLFMADKIFHKNLLNLDQELLKSLVIFSIGTDGGDGPTDAAGAWVDKERFSKLDHQDYLNNFDSYTYFEKVGTLIKSGPTGTNLMDLRGIGPKELIDHLND